MSSARPVELCGGEEDAFRSLIEPHRRALHAHCYQMLGSQHDAEDALQTTLLRAWRALPEFEGRSSLRSWLYRIATNVCLNAIARRRRRLLALDRASDSSPGGVPPGLPAVAAWSEPHTEETHASLNGEAVPELRYERRETLELAFIAAVRHLPARQRAVLILRDVLGFSGQETAESLETTVAAVNAALLRARRTIGEGLPPPSRQPMMRTLGSPQLRELAERFADALELGEIDDILAVLGETCELRGCREHLRRSTVELCPAGR